VASMGDMGARFGMLVVETIAKIRRAYFAQKKPIKAICADDVNAWTVRSTRGVNMSVVTSAGIGNDDAETLAQRCLARIDYNTERPHSALGHLTPQAFARQAETARKVS
jgi:hypothetical protein